MKKSTRFFWNVFLITGNVNAYLIYKDLAS
ncbi:MAG: YqzL family protein [Peptostreptococcaceae bacterium]|nr:YqzL family protein [Peptostreptococcaceae bacterium]